jgi:hypothetical protein
LIVGEGPRSYPVAIGRLTPSVKVAVCWHDSLAAIVKEHQDPKTTGLYAKVVDRAQALDRDRLPCEKVSRRRNGRMAAQQLSFTYDREGDIFYIDTVPPDAEQETEELGDDGRARLNPTTGESENLAEFFFSPRLLRSNLFSLLVTADLRVVGKG